MVKSKFFNMGQILITRGISETVGESERFAAEVVLALHRFAVKDWGDLDAEDIKANEEELNNPDDLYLLAAYRTSKGRIWIVTNRISEKAGDNATTILFPYERQGKFDFRYKGGKGVTNSVTPPPEKRG